MDVQITEYGRTQNIADLSEFHQSDTLFSINS